MCQNIEKIVKSICLLKRTVAEIIHYWFKSKCIMVMVERSRLILMRKNEVLV